MGLDIGPATIALFREVLNDSKDSDMERTHGCVRIDAFSRGTYSMVHAVAASHALNDRSAEALRMSPFTEPASERQHHLYYRPEAVHRLTFGRKGRCQLFGHWKNAKKD
jgi:hypothetical protein